MEIELEPRVKPLDYKVKGVSRESPSQKAANVLDSDLRTHWSTATNTKEWILLELDVRNPLFPPRARLIDRNIELTFEKFNENELFSFVLAVKRTIV